MQFYTLWKLQQTKDITTFSRGIAFSVHLVNGLNPMDKYVPKQPHITRTKFVDFVDVNLEKFIEEMYIVQLLTNLSKMYISTFNI